MEFYYGNNLIKEDFLSTLVGWKPESAWKLKAVGYPYLTLNIKKKSLFLNFLERKRNSDVFTYEVMKLNISAEDKSGSLLMEARDGLEDFGIAFSNPDSCSKFLSLVDYYQNLSYIMRFIFVETNMPKRRGRCQKQTSLFSQNNRKLWFQLSWHWAEHILDSQCLDKRRIHILPNIWRSFYKFPDSLFAKRALAEFCRKTIYGAKKIT